MNLNVQVMSVNNQITVGNKYVVEIVDFLR